MKPLVCALVAMLAVGAAASQPVLAQRQGDFSELPPELEARAQRLYVELMCPACDGQTISQSRAPIAAAMRATIRDELRSGASDSEIMQIMVDSFGQSVLASPPKRGASLAVWLIPPAALLLGAGAVFLALRSMRRGPNADPETPDDSPLTGGALVPYLRLVDEELGDRTPNPRAARPE